MTEKYVNLIDEQPEEGKDYGYVSVFRPVDEEHETRLTSISGYESIVVAEASPLACPVESDLSKSKFCEKYGTVPTWVGMERKQ